MSVDLWDVIIVGAGPAGLNAALVVGRCRRKVLVFGTPRNAASRALHGFLTRDGIEPAELRRISSSVLRWLGSSRPTAASTTMAGGTVWSSDRRRYERRLTARA